MTHVELWQSCLKEAARRVDAARAEWPGCGDALGFDVGGSSSQGSSKFARQGTSLTERSHQVGPGLSGDISDTRKGSQIPTSVSDAENVWLTTLLGLTDSSHSGSSLLDTIKSLLSGSYNGDASLGSVIARNPYSQDYENSTAALYNRNFDKARAAAQSGPGNVRGGQARTGFELAELGAEQSANRFREIRGQQDKEAGTVMNAIQLANMIEQMRRGQQMQAVQTDEAALHTRRSDKGDASRALSQKRALHTGDLALASQVLGTPKVKTTDDLSGQGSQSSSASNWGVGLTCCFIFLEALNGRLPLWVRLGRDEFCTPMRKAGYRWMSTWLVPAMQRSKTVRWLVNTFMIRPFLYQGFYFYVLKKHSVFKPICYAWFGLWSFLGWLNTYGKFLDRSFSESR